MNKAVRILASFIGGRALLPGLMALSLLGCGRTAPAAGGADRLIDTAQPADAADGTARPDGLRAEPARPERPAPSLTLTDQYGQPWSLDQGRGRVLLLFFGYTHCPDYCPQTLAVLGEVRNALGTEADKTRVVMVSADPERDRPEVLAAFLGDRLPNDIGLTGELDVVTAMAAAFGAEFHKDPVRQAGGAPGGADDYSVTHTGRLYLIDPQGQIRGSYLGALSPEDVVHDVRILLGVSP